MRIAFSRGGHLLHLLPGWGYRFRLLRIRFMLSGGGGRQLVLGRVGGDVGDVLVVRGFSYLACCPVGTAVSGLGLGVFVRREMRWPRRSRLAMRKFSSTLLAGERARASGIAGASEC